MKRPSSPSSAPSKKQKKSPRVSETVIVVPAEERNDRVVDASWEKVKKRKQKKAEKRDAKLDVCVFWPVTSLTPYLTKPYILRRTLPVFCIRIQRSSSVEIPLASTYRLLHSTSFIYRTHYCQQDVRDFVLHIIADAPPPGWIRVQVSLPHLYVYAIFMPSYS